METGSLNDEEIHLWLVDEKSRHFVSNCIESMIHQEQEDVVASLYSENK